MALYVDCAFLPDIIEVAKTVPLAGVTTNPSILLAAYERGQRLDPTSLLNELLQSTNGLVFVQPGATQEEEMLVQARASINADVERVIPKLPMTRSGLRVGQILKRQGLRVAFTAVTSVAQAYTAAMVGADYIIPYYNRLERAGVDASDRVAQMAELLHNQQLKTRILAASIKSSTGAASALLAGAHDLTAPPQVLLEMITDELTEQAIDKFTQDWQKMKKL
jgi:TalC/MipB family fructose-6-phosphate aldolase